MTLISLENLTLFQQLNKNYIDSKISEYDDYTSFPETGESNTLYINKTTGSIYYWNGEYVNINESIVKKSTYLEFPTVGKENVIYIDTTENAIYHFSEQDLKYYIVSSDWHNIKIIDGSF